MVRVLLLYRINDTTDTDTGGQCLAATLIGEG
jgi:hypothetical protein